MAELSETYIEIAQSRWTTATEVLTRAQQLVHDAVVERRAVVADLRALGLSQREAARLLGVSQSRIVQVGRGFVDAYAQRMEEEGRG